MAGASLLQSDHGVLYIHANLIDIFLEAQFVLAYFEHTGDVVGLRSAIANGDVQRKARRVIGIIPAEYLGKQIAIPAGEISDAGLRGSERREVAGQSIVGELREGL